MKIFTLTCPECGSIIAANVLESNRCLRCPGLDCTEVHEFTHLDAEAQQFVLGNIDDYSI